MRKGRGDEWTTDGFFGYCADGLSDGKNENGCDDEADGGGMRAEYESGKADAIAAAVAAEAEAEEAEDGAAVDGRAEEAACARALRGGDDGTATSGSETGNGTPTDNGKC